MTKASLPRMSLLPIFIERLERFYGPLPQPPHDPFALYLWQVLSVHTTPPRRDAAMNALRRIPALTPDAIGRAARGKLEAAIAHAGPYREERLRALIAGVNVFRRHRDLPEQLRGPLPQAQEALALLPHLTPVSGQWMLLLAGDQLVVPADPDLSRVLSRLGGDADSALAEIGGVLSALQRTTLYLSLHGQATCLEADPICHICPLKPDCPFPAA